MRHPYECDADRASEESDLSFLHEIQALAQGPVREGAPEGPDGSARLRIVWEELTEKAR